MQRKHPDPGGARAEQRDLFGADGVSSPAPCLPPGMRYEQEFLSLGNEAGLLAHICALPLENAAYKQYEARRRIMSYGGRYDFSRNELLPAAQVPDWLHPLRAKAAEWAELDPSALSFCLIAEYSPGAPLGWHRDVPEFESVVGVSLAGVARMRLRRYPPRRPNGAAARAEYALQLAPRSIYTLQAEARWNWQHAISPTKELRYSITFRSRAAAIAGP